KGYNAKEILNWYTKETFLYKVVNNALRIASKESINTSRMIFKHIERAIKDIYMERSKNFSGLLFRGARISQEEWNMLGNNVGKEIEMYGFISTSKNKDIAVQFAKKDFTEKILVTIIVPGTSDKGEQGFAELKDISQYSS